LYIKYNHSYIKIRGMWYCVSVTKRLDALNMYIDIKEKLDKNFL